MQRASGIVGIAHRVVGQDIFVELVAVERLARADRLAAKPAGSG